MQCKVNVTNLKFFKRNAHKSNFLTKDFSTPFTNNKTFLSQIMCQSYLYPVIPAKILDKTGTHIHTPILLSIK